MPSFTPNYNLYVYNTTTDGSSTFLNFRDNIAGIGSNSNMLKIDTALYGLSGSIVSLGTARGAVLLTLTYAGANAYTASSANITTLYTGLTIIGIPNQNSDATMGLTINALSPVYLMKGNGGGSYTNIAANDLIAGKAYYFVYDGTRFLWVNATSADQISTSGTPNNLLMISSSSGIVDSTYSATATATANKIPISTSGSKLDTWISDATSSTKGIASFNAAGFTVSSGSVVLKSSGVDHLQVSASGVNTHAQIDTHIANLSNPHSTTASQVNAIPYVSASVVNNILTANGTSWVSSTPPSGGSNSICDGRLSLSSASPVMTSDVTSASTIYYSPYIGHKIALYDGSSTWNIRSFSQLSSSLSGLTANTNYDVFVYDNSGTPALELLSWGTNTAYSITSASAAASCVITYNNTTQAFAIGDVVCVQGITGNIGSDVLHNTFTVTAVATISAGSSYTVTLASVNTTGKTYTSGGTIRLNKNTRATSLVYQDGVLVKSGDTTRRYVGTVRINGSGGLSEAIFGGLTIGSQTYGSILLWNYYNRVNINSSMGDGTVSSYTYNSLTWRASNGNWRNRIDFLVGIIEDSINGIFEQGGTIASNNWYVSIGYDRNHDNNGIAAYNPGANFISSIFSTTPTPGFHYFASVEKAGASATYYANGGSSIYMALILSMRY